MRSELLGTVYLLLPLLGGALVHGVCMRFDWLGRRWFGHSKTWRGPLLVALGSAGVWWLQQQVLPALAALELVDYRTLPGAGFGALAGSAPRAVSPGPMPSRRAIHPLLTLIGYGLRMRPTAR